jgi:uncharacterized lipoprotein YajG
VDDRKSYRPTLQAIVLSNGVSDRNIEQAGTACSVAGLAFFFLLAGCGGSSRSATSSNGQTYFVDTATGNDSTLSINKTGSTTYPVVIQSHSGGVLVDSARLEDPANGVLDV